MHKISIVFATLLFGACSVANTGSVADRGDSKHRVVILEGDALAYELANSPVRTAPVDFLRVGVIWDAARADSLEMSVSVDRESWSPWRAMSVHHVEAELGSSFVGEFSTPEEAVYYRLRGTGDTPTFVSLEFFEDSLSDVIEDGDDSIPSGELAPELAAQVNPRSSWGARAARCSSPHSPYRLTVHHTVTPTDDSMSPQARLRQIQSFHQDVRGWCDVGYHFLVSRDGRLWQGRPAESLGSHVGGANTGNVGISFMGTHTSTPATGTQLTNVGSLIATVTEQYGIDISSTTIKGHRDRGSTSCPGDALYAQLPELIERAGNGGGPDQPPPADTFTIKGIIYEGSDTSERIADAVIKLGDLTTTSSSTGYYEFTDVPAGVHLITVNKDGFLPQTVTREASGGVTWASVGLSRDVPTGTAILQGVVYTGGNSANRVPDAAITLSTGHSITADGNGFFKLEQLPPGPVTVTASAPGFPTRSVERTLVNNSTTWGSVHLQ